MVSYPKKEKTQTTLLNPTTEQSWELLQSCGIARHAYNWGLQEWHTQLSVGRQPSLGSVRASYNDIRHEQFPWADSGDVTGCAVDSGFYLLALAYATFFRQCAAKDTNRAAPRFKSKETTSPYFRVDGSLVRVRDREIYIGRMTTPIHMVDKILSTDPIRAIAVYQNSCGWNLVIHTK